MNTSRTSPLTVIFIIDILGKIGGAERNISQLVNELRHRGHKVIIFPLQGGEQSKKLQEDGFRVYDANVTRIYGLSGLKALFRIIRIVRGEQDSVIMTYHESSDFLGLLVSILMRIPIISSRRDMGFKLNARHIWAYRLFNHFFDHISTVSSAVKKIVLKTQWTKASNVTVVPNGVEFFPTSNGSLDWSCGIEFTDGYLNVCCVANIRPIKGHKHLINAVDLVIKRFPNTHFFFVGKIIHDEPYCADVLRQVKDLGLANVVKFCGEVPPDCVPTLLASMDISVLSSLSEGMSNTILESMAAAKPVVATAVGGNPELVEDGKNGYLVPPEDSESMAEALHKLLVDPDLRYTFGQHGKSRVESEFSVIKMVERYEDLLQYIVLKKKLGRRRRFLSRLKKMIKHTRFGIKILVTSIIYHTGLISIYRWIKRTFHLGRVKILCFHDISNLAKKHPQFSISMLPDSFVKFLDFLAQNYKIVSIEEAIRLLETGKSLTDDVFTLTFDDCYKGWIDYVLPACQQHQVPHAIFISTGPLDSGIPLFYDALIFLAENTWRKVANLSPWGLGVFLLDNPENILYFVENIHRLWRERSKVERDRFLQELSEYFGVSLNSENFKNMLLNWDDLHHMDQSGVTIGVHTVSHPLLTALTAQECSSEIYQSKKRLEKKLGHSINFFAYPYGSPESYNHSVIKMVEEAKFRNAFTLRRTNTKQYIPFEIDRRTVTPWMFAGPNGNSHKPLLATELCGLGEFVFGRVFIQRGQQESSTYL